MVTARFSIAAIAVLLACAPASSETYPSRPIEVIVPFPPGGTSDLSVRFLADKWKEFLGQPILIVNKAGAGSGIGARYVATSKPDGYTLLIASETSLLSVPNMQPEAGYTRSSFTYLFAYGKGSVVFSVRSDSPWKSLPEFVAAAKQKPGDLTFASYGIGTMGHFTAELLWKELGVQVRHIPYKSSPEAITAMLGGHTSMAVPSLIGAIDKQPDVRILATAADERMPFAPEIPTLRDLGYRTALSYFNILVGPAGMPADVVAKIIDAHQKAYAKYKTEIDAAMVRLELTPVNIPGRDVAKLIDERDGWYRDVAPEMGIRR